jgi:CRP/FNR family cyclic AMP-dependent transcriptional regulator
MAGSPGTTLTEASKRGFLSVLTEVERDALLERGVSRRFQRGTTLFHEHDESDRVVVVLEGRLKVYSVTPDGKEVVFAFRNPGDLLGELSAIDGRPRSASVAALEPVEVVFVAAMDFRAFLQRHPRVALLVLEMLSWRLRDADRKRVEFAAYDAVGRVAARLTELCEEHGTPAGTGVDITLPLSQDELAGWTGSSREAVGKALHTLRELGWVQTGRRRITVLDLEALRRRAM